MWIVIHRCGKLLSTLPGKCDKVYALSILFDILRYFYPHMNENNVLDEGESGWMLS